MRPIINDDSTAETVVSRPVTDRSRITGVDRSTSSSGPLPATEFKTLDWGAILASVVSGIAITTVLMILGIATGLISGNENTDAGEAAGILGAMGAWSVVAAVIGTFVGCMLGGRLARWLDRGSLAYHALTSWGVATITAVVLASLVTLGFSTAANSAATSAIAADMATTSEAEADGAEGAAVNSSEGQTGQGDNARTTNEEAADNTADALGGAGVALTIGLLLTLVAAFGGWWVGSRKRLTDFEREDSTRDDVAVA